MKIAILGATSQIAKDLIQSLAGNIEHELTLFARRPQVLSQWLIHVNLDHRYVATDFSNFSIHKHFDAILNFVGVGDPARATVMGASIFDLTLKYDEMALTYIQKNKKCRYIFLSSGAAYGSDFRKPAAESTKASIEMNNLNPGDWYGIAKLHAECRHRALADLSITDIRVFNYFSRSHNLEASFLITDILRAISDGTVLLTSPDLIVRDYLHPEDLYQLVNLILYVPEGKNAPIDCYTLAPIDKHTLLETMSKTFRLKFKLDEALSLGDKTNKPYYYSTNYKASEFGYEPKFSSIAGIVEETSAFLEKKNQKKSCSKNSCI